MFLDVDGSTCLATAVFPTGPRSCRLVTEYLFSPEAFDDPDFDPSPVVQFNELVTRQDSEACERVQRGVTSRAFDHGVFPAKDSWVHGFDQRYLRDVEERASPTRPGRRARRHPAGPAKTGLSSSSASSGCAAARSETGRQVRQRVQVDGVAATGAEQQRSCSQRQQQPAGTDSRHRRDGKAVSANTSVKTPPSPTISTGPNRGSRTQPRSPRPRARCPPSTRRRRQEGRGRPPVRVRRPDRVRVGSPSTTPPPSDLCSRPIAFSTNGNAISACSAASSSPGCGRCGRG